MKGRAGGHKSGMEIMVVVLCLILLGFFVSMKEGFHMDELLSFELANAEYNPWIVPTQPEGRLAKFVHNEIDADTLGETIGNLVRTVEDVIKNRGNSKLLTYKADVYEEPIWITGEQFQDYITVEKKDAFHYLSVYFNVKDDNHPPLHFMLLHTVSSIFRGNARPWMGCVINLAATAAILVLLIKTGRLLAEVLGMGRYSRFTGILCAILYGLTSGAVATVLLIRMYALLTLWCVALLYLVLVKWRNKSFDRHNKRLIAVTVMGFWTQYFFLFYCLILAATVGVLLLVSKRSREFWCLVRTFVIAALIGVGVFPFAIADVLSSGRGVEALENLSRGFGGYGERIAAFAGILWNRVLSFGFWLLLVACAVACLVLKFRRRADLRRENRMGKPEGRGAYAAMVLLPMGGYFLLAARMSPYLVDRYMMPLFPLAALAGGVFLSYVLALFMSYLLSGGAGNVSDVSENGSCLWMWCVFVLAAVLQAQTLVSYDGEYLYRGYQMQESVAAAYEGEACICIYDGVGYYENLKEFTYYEKSLLLTAAELETRRDEASIEELGQFVLLIKGGVSAEDVLAVLAKKYGFVPREQTLSVDSVHGDRIYIMIPSSQAAVSWNRQPGFAAPDAIRYRSQA